MSENISTDEVLDRCLAAVSSCMQRGNDSRANERMRAEFRDLALEVSHWQLSGESKVDLFLLPMEEELILRHGVERGRAFYYDFIDAFWIQTWTDVPLDLDRLLRTPGSLLDWMLRVQADRGFRRQIIKNQDLSASFPQN